VASPEHAHSGTTVGPTGVHPLARALTAVSELAGAAGLEQLLKSAVAFARDGIGFDRAVLFLRDPAPRLLRLRGAWAVAPDGTLTDVRGVVHQCTTSEHSALLHLHRNGRLWQQLDAPATHGAAWLREAGMDGGAVIATPVVAAQRLVGVLYNGAEPGAPLDEAKQVEAAILCGSLGMLLLPHRHRLAWRASELPGPRSFFVERVRAALNEAPSLRGIALARRFGVSAGHLARAFKREVGVSLVEYRHRLLLGHFFAALDRGNVRLLDAANEAGFGSYAQFHRVYRRLTGESPNEALARSHAALPPGAAHPARSVGPTTPEPPPRAHTLEAALHHESVGAHRAGCAGAG
jgi:AraC-like DNA-binding protein